MADTSRVDLLHVRMLGLLRDEEVSGSRGGGAQAFAILLAPCIANVVSICQVTQKQQFEPLSVIGTRALKCLQDDPQSLRARCQFAEGRLLEWPMKIVVMVVMVVRPKEQIWWQSRSVAPQR